MTDAQRDRVTAAAALRYRLPARPAQVLRALLDGVPRKHLGAELGIAENTIKVHARRLLAATRCSTLDELVWLLRGWPDAVPLAE